MSVRIPLARPTVGAEELDAQARALRSGRLVLGPENLALEAALAAITGLPHAVVVASGTAALHAALAALTLPPGGEVLVPAFTFPAPAHVVAALGLVPVAVDVDASTWNMSPGAAARAVTPKTCAVLAVDQFGLPAEHAALAAAAPGRIVVEDAACAIGATGLGAQAAVACLSFHPRKIVTTGEGGAVLTGDATLAEKMRQFRNHGQAAPGHFARLGLNLRLAETNAAIGRPQLERLPGLLAERRARVAAYREALAVTPITRDLAVQADDPGRVWQTFAVVLPPTIQRDAVVASMRDRGIEVGPATYALHRIGSLAGRPGFTAEALPIADRLHDHALALPLYGGMSDDQVGEVVDALAAALS